MAAARTSPKFGDRIRMCREVSSANNCHLRPLPCEFSCIINHHFAIFNLRAVFYLFLHLLGEKFCNFCSRQTMEDQLNATGKCVHSRGLGKFSFFPGMITSDDGLSGLSTEFFLVPENKLNLAVAGEPVHLQLGEKNMVLMSAETYHALAQRGEPNSEYAAVNKICCMPQLQQST
ncbi:MAG: hypothetical protein ACRDAX_00215 [Propionibacteriaceae bacterium]